MGVKTKTKKVLKASINPPQKSLDQKLTPQETMPNFLALEFPESKTVLVVFIRRTTWLGYMYAGTTMNLQIALTTQKNPAKSSNPRKYFPKFSYLKIPRFKNFNPPKKFFYHPRHLKSRVPSWTLSLRNE